ncbi:MAG: hypothetical protein HQK67_12095 [Desulfamplus sp.]|nr:hypothetical protein [Desulfamplus sp.]
MVIKTMPWVCLATAVMFPLLSLMLYFTTINNAIHQGSQAPELIEKFRLIILAMAFLGVLISATMFATYRIMVSHIYQMEIICTENEIIQYFPNKEIRIFWSEIKKVRKTALGRMQQWSIIDNNGKKIKADAAFIEMQKPLPELKMTWRGETLKYPDGSTQPLTLKENRLYSIISEKANCVSRLWHLPFLKQFLLGLTD